MQTSIVPHLLLVFGLVVGPALAWGAYVQFQNRDEPRSVVRMGAGFVLGMGSALMALVLFELVAGLGVPDGTRADAGTWELFQYALLVIGPVEEIAKASVFVLLIHALDFRRKRDHLASAFMVGIGFASYENVYLMQQLSGAELVSRALASPFVHAMFSSIWGYAYGWARARGRHVWPWFLGSLALAGAVHGVYDFLSLTPRFSQAAALVILLASLWQLRTNDRLRAERRRYPAARPPLELGATSAGR